MSSYTITKVSALPPKVWSFTDKRTNDAVPMETYKVMLEGIVEPVEVNKKPGQKPQVGEVLVGALEESDFGTRFKKERKPFTPGGGFNKDNAEIKAEWAIKQAVVWLIATKGTLDEVEPLAVDFSLMLERVKSKTVAGGTQAQVISHSVKSNRSAADTVFPVSDEEPITIPDGF